jgi:hypothetical protein
MVHLATRIVLHIARVLLVGLFWLSPMMALGLKFGEDPAKPATVGALMILGLGFLCLAGAWMVDRRLRPDVGFWRKRRAAN